MKINTKDKDGKTAFHFACINGNLKILEMFLRRSIKLGIDLNSRDCNGMTGFHFACKIGCISIVEMMIDYAESSKIDLKAKTRADLKSKTVAGKTAFQLATNGVKKLIRKKMPTIAM